MQIVVGSNNPVKIQASKEIFQEFFEGVRVFQMSIDPEVPSQPFSLNQIISGAYNRAKNSIERFIRYYETSADFGIGIEAGIAKIDIEGTLHKQARNLCHPPFVDIQVCVIMNHLYKFSIGYGSGFAYPETIIEGVKEGKSVGALMSDYTGIPELGRKHGAIGFLTKMFLDRKALTKQAVLAALVPWLNPELYQTSQEDPIREGGDELR